jgi:hypothetical protein
MEVLVEVLWEVCGLVKTLVKILERLSGQYYAHKHPSCSILYAKMACSPLITRYRVLLFIAYCSLEDTPLRHIHLGREACFISTKQAWLEVH